jgi:hypothetical protein
MATKSLLRRVMILSFVGVLICAVLFIVLALVGAFTPDAPAGWGQVRPGMPRTQVLALAGSTVSAWPEKPFEAWTRSGVFAERRLHVYYDGERVTLVREGTWFRGYGWLRPRVESLP